MHGLRVVAFGLDCPDPAVPMLVQTIAVIITVVLLGGICFAVAMASRRLTPAVLRCGLTIAATILAIIAAPFTYGLLTLTLACGGLGL